MKKFTRFFIVAFAVLFAAMSFALVGCTDKEDNERALDDIEQLLVGTWKCDNMELNFRADGTVLWSADHKTHKFEHTGRDYDAQRGEYEIIFISGGVSIRLAFFRVQPSDVQLCHITYGVIAEFDDPHNYSRAS